MPPATATAVAVTGIPEAFVFDEKKLAAAGTIEKQELFVFQWLSHVEHESKLIDVVSQVLQRAHLVCAIRSNNVK